MKFLTWAFVFLSAVLLTQSFPLFEDDSTKDDLKKSIDELKEEAKKEIEKLKQEGKGALAVGIDTLEKKLEDLEGQLEKLNPTTEVGKTLLAALEGLVKKVEDQLKEEIKKLSGSYYDVKDDLLLEAEKLKKLAQEEIEKLKKEGKGEIAKGLEAVEKVVLDLESQLQALNPSTEVGKALLSVLENLLKSAENKLEEEIKKLSGDYYDDSTKDDLKKSIDQLKEEAKKAIEKLEAEGKTVLAMGIQALESKLEGFEAQLEALNPNTEVGKTLLAALEGLIKKAEDELKKELAKINGSYYDISEDLKKTVDELKKKAEDEIEKLKKEGKGELAKGLEAIEKRVVDIETQLEQLNPQTELGKSILIVLENLLKKATTDLENEIKKLAGDYFDDSTKDDLKKSIDELKEEAKKAIEKLEAEGKTLLAQGIQALETKLEGLEAQLEALNPTTEVGKTLLAALEGLVKKVEDELKKELAKVNGSYYDVKDELKKLTDQLKKEAQEEIEKLKKEGKGELAKGLEAIEKRVVDIETQVEKLNPSSDIGKQLLTVLENLLKKAEEELEAEIKKLSGSYYDDSTKDDLKKSIDQLKEEAKKAIEKLEAEGKTVLAMGIQALESKLEGFEAQLEALNPNTEVGKTLLAALEGLIKKVEDELKKELAKINGTYYDDTTKDDLKKSIDELKEEAKKAIEKLEAEGKTLLAQGIQALESKLEGLEAQLEALNPTTEVGKTLLAALEGLIKKVEEELKNEIAKISGSYYDVKDELKKLTDQLKKEAQEEIEKLKKEGKGELAKGLEAIEKRVVDIETQVEKLNPSSDVGKQLLTVLENLLKKAEQELEAEIKKLSGSF